MTITNEQVRRINELAQKSKTAAGLTDDERAEQQNLRQLYIDSIRTNMCAELDKIERVDKEDIKK